MALAIGISCRLDLERTTRISSITLTVVIIASVTLVLVRLARGAIRLTRQEETRQQSHRL